MNNSIIIRVLSSILEEDTIITLFKEKLGIKAEQAEVDVSDLVRHVSSVVTINAENVEDLESYVSDAVDNALDNALDADNVNGLEFYVDERIEEYLEENPLVGSDVTELVGSINSLKAENELLKKQVAELFQRMSHACRAFNDGIDPNSL